MFHLLIVDDEEAITDSLADTLPWANLQIDEIHKAYSAREALDIVRKNGIDIMITDIRMPGMDGLQLIESCHGMSPRMKCILLTGYADFEYARKAMTFKVEEYVLKPVRDTDMLDVVERVVINLKKEWEEISSYQRVMSTIRENLPLLRGELLNDLIQGRRYSQQTLADKINMLELPFAINNNCSVLVIRLEEEFDRYDRNSLLLMEYALSNMVEEIFSPSFHVWSCKDTHDFLVYLVAPKMSNQEPVQEQSDVIRMYNERIQRYADQLQESVERYLKGTISIVISGGAVFPDNLSEPYRKAIAVMRRTIGSDHGLFVAVEEKQDGTPAQSILSLYEPPMFIHLLEAGRWEEAKGKLAAIFEELHAGGKPSREYMMEAYYTISAAILHAAHVNGRMLSDIRSQHSDVFRDGNEFPSVQSFEDWAYFVLQQLMESVQSEMENSRTTMIKRVKEFIGQYLSGNVSLQSIADEVGIHPVYLSKIFKLETGESYVDYLFKVRMEQAAFLLKNTNKKIYEITAEVGYQNAPYFIKVFKKHYGVTPQEYREG